MSKNLSALHPRVPVSIDALLTSDMELTERMEALERYMLQYPQSDGVQVNEYRADSVYCRETIIPAGTFAIGMLHKFEHMSIMLEGELVMWTSKDGLKHLSGYNIAVAPPGMKRAGFILKDTKWLTVHSLPCEEEPKDFLTASSYKEYLEFTGRPLTNLHRLNGAESENLRTPQTTAMLKTVSP